MPASPLTPSNPKKPLSSLLDAARPFLRGELELIDPSLPTLIATLRSVGAGECWHKHGSFLAHLTDVYRILHLWGSPPSISLCGLYHSAYSNSYVNLAIFDPSTSRDHLRSLIGPHAERLVHLFCVINRQTLIHDDLLFHYSDEELKRHLSASEVSIQKAAKDGVFDEEEEWRRKVVGLVPAEGLRVRHIKTGEEVAVSRRVVAAFLMMTMADFSDQLFGFQDVLFDNANGRLEFSGNRVANALWPGDGRPGLWLNSVSRMGALYTLIIREEEIYLLERRMKKQVQEEDVINMNKRDEDIEMVIPPVFESCTRVISAEAQMESRDLYWEAVTGSNGDGNGEKEEGLLLKCIEKNPFVGEPHVVLSQVYLGMGRYEEAEKEGEEGLRLMLEWGECGIRGCHGRAGSLGVGFFL